MELFALDLGNKQTKIKSSKKIKVLPSRFVEASKYGNRELLSFAKTEQKDIRDFESNRDSGYTYVWGAELDEDTARPIDTIGFGKERYMKREFKLLVDFALAELALDFPQAQNSILEVAVVTGVPTSDYTQNETLNALEKAIKGDHNVIVDGKSLNIRVKTLFVLPQPTGTILNNIADDKGQLLDNPIINASVGVVDIGGGTLLIDLFKKMNMDTENREQLPLGVYTLYKSIENELKSKGYEINTYEIENCVRFGNNNEKYYWSPDQVQTIDITDIVMKQREKFTREVATEVKTAYKDFKRMQTILITGGGANLLIKETFSNEIGIGIEQYIENSEFANVLGFYKYGLMEGIEETNEQQEQTI
jgi:plasmid segregation protein ParM